MGGAATSSTNGCSHSHTASQLRLHMQSQTAREGERRGECEHQMCADHTLCMVCSHHPKSHTLTVTTPCRWHVNRQGGRRGREKRGRRGSSLIPSIAHPAGTHHPSSPSHTLPLFSSLSFTPTIHAHIITSTNLAPNPLHTTAPPTQPASPHTHTRASLTSPNACASAQRKPSSSSSSSSSSLTTRVPHHHHQQPMSSSTCMPHLHTQAASGTCVSE